jgi:hypothetical protein
VNRVRLERKPGAGEPIHVWPSRGGLTPSEFVWRGRRYRVRALEAAPREPGTPGAVRRWFRVRTTSGLSCVLTQDVAGGAWRIDRLVPSGGGR